MPESFFDEQEEQSAVKAEIVANYFVAWARIMAKRAPKIGYFDFFAGPGRYKTGDKSTPLLILERAIAAEDLCKRLVAIFNDANPRYADTLQQEIYRLPGAEDLAYPPQVIAGKLDDELVEQFEGIRTIPALSFIDPWGYKGLSQRLIHAVIKDWGCDVIFFFNYNRISMGITNPKVQHHMQALFGAQRLAALRGELATSRRVYREELIRSALSQAVREMGAKFQLPFTFRHRNRRVSHYIYFVSKSFRGYDIMKGIMARRGTVDEEGIPAFEFVAGMRGRQLRLVQTHTLDGLRKEMLREFPGTTLTVGDIYERHSVGRPYLEKHYKDVLKAMEEQGEIRCDPSKRPRNTMARPTTSRLLSRRSCSR